MISGSPSIDFHGHVGRWDHLGMVDDPRPILRAMDAAGIDRACVFDIFHPDGTPGNDRTAAFIERHPDRFIGFAYVSPLLPEGMRPELERAVDELGFRAIKLYSPYTPFEYDHPIWDPAYQFAQERGLAVLAHTGADAEPRYLAAVADRFPGANFVAGHSGNVEPYRGQAIEATKRYSNFYLETCSTYRTPGVIEELVDRAGADRILYGSDLPLMDPRAQLGKIVTAGIDDREKRLILGENARRLLKLKGEE
ncbi:amidohydrolase [bacterium]|nr:amidohydrolase [bacterium]